MRRLLTAAALTACLAAGVHAQPRTIDHRYAPAEWRTGIGWPDDWQKTILDDRGRLLYDFGPGPYVTPMTTVSMGVAEGPLERVAQPVPEDPRVPIIQTVFQAGRTVLTQTAFAAVPGAAPARQPSRVERLEGTVGTQGWARPPADADRAFQSVAFGTNRPVRYRLSVPPGSRWQVVMGFAEGYRTAAGQRILALRAEGAETVQFDPLERGTRNEPQFVVLQAADLDRDGRLAAEVHSAGTDPNTYLNALWLVPPSVRLTPAALQSGRWMQRAELAVNAGDEMGAGQAPRLDILHTTATGPGVTPIVEVTTSRPLRALGGVLVDDNRMRIETVPAAVRATQTDTGWRLELPAGTAEATAYVWHGTSEPQPLPNPHDARADAERRWTTSTLPYDRIRVPDERLQDLLDASVRSVYQARERVDGHPQFQPGMALYRGLWVHDATYLIDTALMLGDTLAAREALDGILAFQQPSGQMTVSQPHTMNRETALTLWLMCRYAAMTGNDAWLLSRWDRVQRGVAWMKSLRETTLGDPSTPYHGLFPPGFADGGLGGVNAEYSGVHWTLLSLEATAAAARRLGHPDDADRFDALSANLLASWRTAAARDQRRDPHGNLYLPTKIGSDGTAPPPQAQWMVLEPVLLGSFLPSDDPLVQGTLGMLRAHESQGLVLDVGWLRGGIWAYFGAWYAELNQRMGHRQTAADILYAFANHATPHAAWAEEQMPNAAGPRTVGDYPHIWGSSLLLRTTRMLMASEVGADLHLLAGVPDAWLAPGSTLALDNTRTAFGPLTLRVTVDALGHRASVVVEPVGGAGNLRIDLRGFRELGYVLDDGSALPEEWVGPMTEAVDLRMKRVGTR